MVCANFTRAKPILCFVFRFYDRKENLCRAFVYSEYGSVSSLVGPGRRVHLIHHTRAINVARKNNIFGSATEYWMRHRSIAIWTLDIDSLGSNRLKLRSLVVEIKLSENLRFHNCQHVNTRTISVHCHLPILFLPLFRSIRFNAAMNSSTFSTRIKTIA